MDAFDPTELTATAALFILGFLIFKFLTGRVEKKDAFIDAVVTRMMEKADASDERAQKTTEGMTEAMREFTRVLKAGDDATVKGLNALEKGQIVHEGKAQERHRELVRKK